MIKSGKRWNFWLAGLLGFSGLGDGSWAAAGPSWWLEEPPVPEEVPAEEPAPKEETPTEEELGAEAAEALVREFGVVKDEAALRQMNEIVAALVPHTERPEVHYRVQILNLDDVNALALPGGYIFVTKGLVDFVESEHELAAVLAHEMAHNALKHNQRLAARSSRLDVKMLIGVALAMLLGGGRIDPNTLFLMGSALKTSALSGYGRKVEVEADQAAVHYLQGTPYNPVGLLTFLERLLRLEHRRPKIEWGIFQTHPPTRERVAAVAALLQADGVPLNRRAVTKALRAEVQVGAEDEGEECKLVLGERVIFRPHAFWKGRSPQERVRMAAERLNAQLAAGLKIYQVRAVPQGGNWLVTVRGEVLFTLTPGDAIPSSSPAALAQKAVAAIRRALWAEFVREAY